MAAMEATATPMLAPPSFLAICSIPLCVSSSCAIIPAAPIITTEFVNETRLTRVAVGMPDLRPVVIDHPVSSITNEEVLERVAVIKVQAQEVWLGQRQDI